MLCSKFGLEQDTLSADILGPPPPPRPLPEDRVLHEVGDRRRARRRALRLDKLVTGCETRLSFFWHGAHTPGERKQTQMPITHVV